MDKRVKRILESYCKRGFYLFPIKRETKRPAIYNMLEDASDDIEQLEKWEQKFPNCNWGLSLAKSGLVAVDIDHKHGGMEAWQAICDMNGEPTTLKAITGSGGFHYVFKATAPRYRGKIQNGIDIKYNGYTVVYPSLHQDTNKYYKWVDWKAAINTYPEWLKDLIEKDERVGRQSPTYKFGNKYLDKLVKELKKFPLSYQEWVQAGMAIHASDPSPEGLAHYLDLTEGESYQEGDLEQAKNKWASFSSDDNGISSLTLSYLIRKLGGTVPNPSFEDDKKAFKEAQLEDIRKQKEQEGFVGKNGKLVNWKRDSIIDYFNERGYSFLIGGGNAPFLRVSENKEGGLDLLTMGEKALRDLTAPLHFASVKETSDSVKTVLTPAYREWVESPKRKTYKKVVFKPESRPGELNLWNGLSNREPIEGGLPWSVENLIYESLCNNDQRKGDWLVDWLAHLCQKPWERVSTVPVHISKQGAGKGLLYDTVIRYILGSHYTAVMTSSELMARFNVNLTKKFLTFIDEATWRGNKTEDGILKRLIGSPTISVEEKFGLRYEIENYSRYAIASNNKEAVALEVGNRRYVIIEGNDEMANDISYFGPIVEALQAEDGLAMRQFFGFLLDRDISHFKPYEILKDNKAGAEAKIATIGPVAMFWEDVFFENPRRLWVDSEKLYRSMVFDEFNAFCNKIKTYTKSISPTQFWKITKDLVPSLPDKENIRLEGGKWAKVIKMSPKDFSKQFCETVQIDIPEVSLEEYIIKSDFEDMEFEL